MQRDPDARLAGCETANATTAFVRGDPTDAMAPEPIRIMLAEDDDGHAELIIDHLRQSGVQNPIRRFRDGDEVWEYLNREESILDGAGQYLLLLDIRMPRMDGTEVLRRIKKSPRLHRLPVIVLTTTDDPVEIDHCYDLGCSIYMTKPVDFSVFSEALKRLGMCLMVVRLPTIPGASVPP